MMASDEQLMKQYQGGDYEAFSTLYERYHRRVFGYVRRRVHDASTAEEIFQMIFLKLHRSRHLFDPGLSFAAWLFTVSRTTIIDAMRRKNLEVLEPCLESVPGVPDDGTFGDLNLESLTMSQMELLKMRFIHQMTFKQISQRLQTSPLVIRKRLSRLTQHLRTIILPKEKVK